MYYCHLSLNTNVRDWLPVMIVAVATHPSEMATNVSWIVHEHEMSQFMKFKFCQQTSAITLFPT